MKMFSLVKEEDSALGGKGKKAWGSGLRGWKMGALFSAEPGGRRPSTGTCSWMFVLFPLLWESSRGLADSGGAGGKADLIWDSFPWSFAFCQSRYCYCSVWQSLLTSFLYVQRVGLLPSGSLQYFSLAALFVNYLLLILLFKEKKTILPQKFLSRAVSQGFPPLRAPVGSHLTFPGLYRGKAFRSLVVLGPMSSLGEIWHQVL